MIALVLTVAEEGVPGSEQQASFIKSPVRIGRGDTNDLPLRHAVVSTFHASVEFDEHEVRYVDLKSLNGSELEGERLPPNTPIVVRPGAEVRIPAGGPVPGTVRVRFELRAVTRSAPPAPRPTLFAPSPPATRAQPPAATPRPPTASDPAVEAEAARAFEAAAPALDRAFLPYRATWAHLRATIEAAVRGLRGDARRLALERIAARYPEATAEPEFGVMVDGGGADASAGSAAASTAASAPPHSDAAAARAYDLLRVFCRSYAPTAPDDPSPAELDAVLERVANTLETFARCYIDLRNGAEEFRDQIGLRVPPVEGPLQRAAEPRDVLVHALDPGGSGRERDVEQAFREIISDRLGFQYGVVDGARDLLAHVSPARVERKLAKEFFLVRARSLWRTFEQHHAELAGDEKAIMDLLYGKAFMQTYFAVIGHSAAGELRAPGAEEEG